MSLGRLGAGQSDQPGLLLAVENPGHGGRRGRLAAQDGLEPFFHQLFAHPIDYGNAGLQSLDDPSRRRFALAARQCDNPAPVGKPSPSD